MKYEVEKDETGEMIGLITVTLDTGGVLHFTPLDIGYTIAQNYKEALIGPEVYVDKSFPMSCTTFELASHDANVLLTIAQSAVDYYFDTSGAFVFRGENTPNADRAIQEFVDLYTAGKALQGPAYTVYQVSGVKHVHIMPEFGDNYYLYFYV